MTLYILFAGLGIVIYSTLAFAEAAVSIVDTAVGTANFAFGFWFIYLVSLSILLAAVLVHVHRLTRGCMSKDAEPSTGFPFLMPKCISHLTEEERRALIECVESLSLPVQARRR